MGVKTSDNLPKAGAGVQPRGRGQRAQVWLHRWDQSGKKPDDRTGEATQKEFISLICYKICSTTIILLLRCRFV